MDLDEQRPELPHRAAGRRGRVQERRTRCLGAVGLLRRRAQRIRDPGELLHRPVVEVRRDAPPLVGRCLHRADEQRFAILLRPPQPVAEPPGERHLEEPQQDERCHEETRERQPDPPPGRGYGIAALVRLEEERRAVGRADREIDLVEIAVAALEPVLRAVEVAQLRARGGAGTQHVALVGVQREARSDQSRLVGVDDSAGRVPDLDADDPLAEHALVDDAVDRVERRRIAVEEAGLDRRLHDPLPGERRELSRVP